MDRFIERFVRVMHWATVVIEVLVAFALVALAAECAPRARRRRCCIAAR